MKKVLFVFLFFIVYSYSQQSIKFDFYSDYESSTANNPANIENTIVFSNSSDQNLSFVIDNRSTGSKKLSARLTDKKKHINHFFEVTESKDNTLYSESFTYLFSVQYDRPKCDDNYIYEVEETSENPDFNAKIVVYENKRKKKILSTCFLKRAVSDKSYFTNLMAGVLGHFDRCNRLKVTNPYYIVETAAFINDETGKTTRSVKLMNYGNIDINISIKKIKYESQIDSFNYFRLK